MISVLGDEYVDSNGRKHSWELKSPRLHGRAERAIATAPWRTSAKPKKTHRFEGESSGRGSSGFRLRSRVSRQYRSLKGYIRQQSKQGGKVLEEL